MKIVDDSDYTAAVRFLDMTASRGNPSAQYVLGRMYTSGKWVLEFMKKAVK